MLQPNNALLNHLSFQLSKKAEQFREHTEAKQQTVETLVRPNIHTVANLMAKKKHNTYVQVYYICFLKLLSSSKSAILEFSETSLSRCFYHYIMFTWQMVLADC